VFPAGMRGRGAPPDRRSIFRGPSAPRQGRCAPPWTRGGRESPGPWSPIRFRGRGARCDGGRPPAVSWPGGCSRRPAPMTSAFDFPHARPPRLPGGGYRPGGGARSARLLSSHHVAQPMMSAGSAGVPGTMRKGIGVTDCLRRLPGWRCDGYLSASVNFCQSPAGMLRVVPSRSVVSLMRMPPVPVAVSTHAPPLPSE
jgi:hypothetical protein